MQQIMASIIIAFEEGFLNDIVIVRINGKEVFHKKNVKTDLRRGYAGSFQLKNLSGHISIDFALPNRNISKTIFLDLHNTINLAVAIKNGELQHRISEEPLGYL
jgi:hypothetical protein